MRLGELVRTSLVPIAASLLLGCAVQWVAPFNADLQNRASDLIAEISAWELQMRSQAGTIATDPRNPKVQADFAKWLGELEAMGLLQTSIDPGVIDCRAVMAATETRVRDLFLTPAQKAMLAKAGSPSPQAVPGNASPSEPPKGCESIPIVNATKDIGLLQQTMQFQCKVPGASDAYFADLASDRPASQASAGSPTALSRAMCLAVFAPPTIGGAIDPHGANVSAIIGDLAAIVLAESGKKPKAPGS